MCGARYFTKINVILFFFLRLGIAIGYKHYKWTWSRLNDNWDPQSKTTHKSETPPNSNIINLKTASNHT